MPIAGKDKKGDLKGYYSDYLHILYYLNKKDIPRGKLTRFYEIASKLESSYGYMSSAPYKGRSKSWLWYDVIWPWEQAYIALAALKFGKKDITQKAKKVLAALITFDTPFIEYFYMKKEKHEECKEKEVLKPSGCYLQLWSVAGVKTLLEIGN